MAYVVVHEGESIDSAIRRFQSKVKQDGIIEEIKKRSHYSSKSEKKHQKKKTKKRKVVINDESDIL